jgi:uncharacterized protein YecE (DUF72 family)
MIKVGTCGFPIARKKYYKEFNVIEINSTFYSIPDIEWVKKIRNEAPENFEFTFKAFQGITHDVNSFTWRRSKIKNYKELKGKVGYLRNTKEVFEFWEKQEEIANILRANIIVIQLPNSFKDTKENIENAYNFFNSIGKKYRIAIELRGWSKENREKICKEFDLIDIVDINVEEPVYDSDIKYYRLHGLHEGNRLIYNYDYSKEELNKIKEKVLKYNKKDSYVMFNNSMMYENAKEFLELIRNV